MADEATTTATDTATSATTTAAETSGDSTATTTTTPEATATATDVGEAALGDAGKKALDAMKAKWKEAEAKAKTEADARAALEAQIAGKEAEFTAQQEAQRVKDEALAAANERIIKAELRAAAKGKVVEEALADLPRLMDVSEIEVGSDGEVDPSQIARAIDNLIASKPYLAAQGGRFQGSADGGARKDDTKVAQLTRSDLERMTPEQIVEARSKGQFSDLLSGR